MRTVKILPRRRRVAKWLGALVLWVATGASPVGAGDTGRVDALLGQAQALIDAARAELATTNPTNPTNEPPAGRVDLGTFAWSTRGITDPAGFAYARRSEPTVAYSKRNIQWYELRPQRGGLILHAAWPLGATAITGEGATWYLFVPGTVAQIPAELAHYTWAQAGPPSTDANGTWIKFRRVK